MSNRKFILVWLLFASALVVGWTELVDNFYGKNLDKTTFQAPATNGIPKYDGTKWVVGSDSGGPETLSISDLTDVGAMTEASGDLLYFDTVWTRLAKGVDGQVLKLASGLPSWAADAGGAETLSISDLTDVAAMTEASGDLLVFGTAWDRLAKGSNSTVLQVSSGGTVQWGGVTSAMITDGEIVAGDLATATVNRLNPAPAAAGNIPVDAGAGSPYTVIDGSDADTTKALFATGAAAAPAFRVLAGGDIDELIRLEELSDVATMTEAAGDMIIRNAGNTAWDKLAVGTSSQVLRGGSAPNYGAVPLAAVQEVMALADLSDATMTGLANNDILMRIGGVWVNAVSAGDVTWTGSGNTITTTIGNAKVTLAKMADLAQDQFIVRTTASTGVPQTATITSQGRDLVDETSFANMRTKLSAYGTVTKQVFTSGTATYTPTSGALHVIIECWGGGGAGGSVDGISGNNHSAAGGGAGGYSRLYTTAAAASGLTVTVGGGGSAAAAGNNAGGNGNDSSVGTICVAKGGTGGAGSAAGAAPVGGAGGVAGTGDVAATGARGNAGFTNSGTTIFFPGGNGADSSVGTGGAGGSAASGVSAGNAGSGFASGGGGGATYNTASDTTGGNGAGGLVVITEFTP